MKSNILQLLGVAATALLLCSSCGSSSDIGGGSNNGGKPAVTEGNTTVTFTPDSTRTLKNPLTGWVIYSSFTENDNFWDTYDHFPGPDGDVKLSDYATTLYLRGLWSDFEPKEGIYIWNDNLNTPNARRFRALVQGARERGLKLAFTFVVDSRDKHQNATPEYVKEAGCKTYPVTTGSWSGWSPYPDDPVFQQKYEKFLKAVADKFDDADVTQFISGFGLGKWGEGHTLIYSTGDGRPRQAVADWISSFIAKTFTHVPLLINCHRCLLATNDYTTNQADLDESERLIDGIVNKGFSIRHDALGMHTYYSQWEKDYVSSQNYNRPFIGEGGWVIGSHGDSYKGDGYRNQQEVRQGEYNDARNAHANMLDWRYNSNVTSSETYSWWNDAPQLVKNFIRYAAYRLYPEQVSAPKNVKVGGTMTIDHTWKNLGWGYCPTNIPQWNQKYKVAFALLDAQTMKPVKVLVDPIPCLNKWVANKSFSYTTSIPLSDIPAGTYKLATGIIDTTKDNVIGIQLSMNDSDMTSDGWLMIMDVTVK